MLYAIVAHDLNRAIGGGNDLLWHLPNDLKFFKDKTRGFPIIMGRKTYDSLGRPLPGRRNMVVSRQTDWSAEGVEVFATVEAAIAALEGANGFIVGGGEIYRLALPMVDVLYATVVHTQIEVPRVPRSVHRGRARRPLGGRTACIRLQLCEA
jgi:dihydrofolate reductase